MSTVTALTDDAYRRLGAIIAQVQSRYILRSPPREVFDPLLTDLLQFTGSEYGFIAELLRAPEDNHRFLRIQVLTDISWDGPTSRIYADHLAGKRCVEFHNMETLFGAAVTSGTTVISNDPAGDPRSGGRPTGHRPMNSFIGAPLFHGGEMIGMVGMSNRPGGYSSDLALFLEPLFASVGSILGGVRLEAANRIAEEALIKNRVALVAAEAAQKANAAKTEFLSRMSHELRTPLNAVLGFAQLLQLDPRTPLNAAQAQRVGHIERAGGHLLAMINDVLDLSRIESGTFPLSIGTVDVRRTAHEAMALVDSGASQGRVALSIGEPSGRVSCSYVRADRLRLRQILVNLLSNAVKYNRVSGQVTIRWHCVPDEQRVLIEVQDDGVGISAEHLSHLFEPFNRLGAETTAVEGTGIGLVISRRLAQSMGGDLGVTSEKGVGTTVSLRLPMVSEEDNPDSVTRPAELGDGKTSGRCPEHTVLYVDDNALNVDVAVAILQSRDDLRVVTARSGREAIEAAQREIPDLVLLDMHLGDMSGLEVRHQFSLDAALARIPCIAVSADAMQGTIADAERAGFKSYLTKPLHVKTFLTCVDEALRASSPKRL